MHRIDGDGNVSGEFTQTPTPGNNSTEVTADWLNAVQNEIVNFLETNGVTLDKADNTQFTVLMAALFSAAKKVAGDYEIETVLIPDTTDKKLKITNKQTGKYFTITETRSPDGTSVEATHALGAVADGIDWIFDFSMHNYDAGIMKGVHVLQCFNADTKSAMYWVFRHRPTGDTGYGTLEDYYMMKLDETNGLQVNAAASEGVAPTWVKVLTESDKSVLATAHGHQEFLASGSFVVPAGVTSLFITGCAAGGNGAAADSSVGGGGGGGGEIALKKAFTVTPGDTLTVTIGAAGSVSNTSIGTFILNHGVTASGQTGGGFSAFGSGSFRGKPGGNKSTNGYNGIAEAGHTDPVGTSIVGGGGGGGFLENGTNGGAGSTGGGLGFSGGGGGGSSGSAGGAGGTGGYGGGGGGGGAINGAGGQGGAGYLMVEW